MVQSSHHNLAFMTLLAQKRPATAKVARIARVILIPNLNNSLRRVIQNASGSPNQIFPSVCSLRASHYTQSVGAQWPRLMLSTWWRTYPDIRTVERCGKERRVKKYPIRQSSQGEEEKGEERTKPRWLIYNYHILNIMRLILRMGE